MARHGAVLALAAVWACGSVSAGELSARWSGGARGSLRGPAHAGWCATSGWLELTLMRGDTGVAAAVFPIGALRAGVYPIVAAGVPVHPGAAVALRWLDSTTVQQYAAQAGTLRLEQVSPREVSGTMTATLRAVGPAPTAGSASGIVTLAGRFTRVPVATAPDGCPAAAALTRHPVAGVH